MDESETAQPAQRLWRSLADDPPWWHEKGPVLLQRADGSTVRATLVIRQSTNFSDLPPAYQFLNGLGDTIDTSAFARWRLLTPGPA